MGSHCPQACVLNMGFLVKESVKVGEGQYWERQIFKRPFSTLEAAKKACSRKELDDNQPFVEDGMGFVVYAGTAGEKYESNLKKT